MTEISISLISAFTLGLLHSLEPSHAKVVLASYFLNRKRTLMEAIVFAVTVTIAHTLVIYLLAWAGYSLGPFFYHKTIEHWSELSGGILMVSIGGWMFWNERKVQFHKHESRELGHFFHHHDCHHNHQVPSSWRQIFLLGFCSGAVPCMSGLAVLVLAWTQASPLYGLGLVTVFSIGLGLVVLMMCIVMQQTAHVMDRYWKNSERWTRFLPILSSIIIMAFGISVMIQGLFSLSSS